MTEATRSSIDELNQSTMKSAVDYYASLSELGATEKIALASVASEVRNNRILDIGVGGGRTVGALLELSSNYTGVDYVEEMVFACRRRFPGVRFELADARAMPQFADGSLELIMFAWSGICMVDHAGRMAILREVHRLLSPGGYFLFSTYNRNSAEHDRLFSFPKLTMPRETRDLARRIASFCLHTTHRLVNRIRYRSRAVATAEYSIINDQSHDYCTMLYYITLDQQRRQLERVGFKPNPRVYGRDGQLVDQDDSKLGDTMLVLAQR